MAHNIYQAISDSIQWEQLRGPLPVPMTNDYLFRALLQRDENVLKSLLCSLLHLHPDKVRSVSILNPIELGEQIDDKEFILDIKIELNESLINLELQVINERNWPERSLCYLCRAFDNLNRGEEYEAIRPTVHIGLLDFTLFPDNPEFYATYYFMNEKNHHIYSDKLRLSVVDLTQINLATDEDQRYEIVRWASFFKAIKWEDVKTLMKTDSLIKEAATAVYQLTQDEKIRQRCEARQDYLLRTAGRERRLKEMTAKAEQAEAERDQAVAERDQAIEKAGQAAVERDLAIEKANLAIAEKNKADAELKRYIQKYGSLADNN